MRYSGLAMSEICPDKLSHNSISRRLKDKQFQPKEIFEIIKHSVDRDKPGVLIVDDTGLSKKHTLKTQVIVDKKTRQIICTAFSNGRRHDFRLFKESKIKIHPGISVLTDTGYQGLKKLHANTNMPKKKSKKKAL